jgi:sulfatase maturation enzyme AslB (radical SAM superfamily)
LVFPWVKLAITCAAMRGLQLLKDNDIPFHVIAVITGETLGYALEIYGFFEAAGVERLGFNIEEVEAEHGVSTLGAGHEERVREFYQTFSKIRKDAEASPFVNSRRQNKRSARASLCGNLISRGSMNRCVHLGSSASIGGEIFPPTRRSFLGCRSSPTVSSLLGASSATISRMR